MPLGILYSINRTVLYVLRLYVVLLVLVVLLLPVLVIYSPEPVRSVVIMVLLGLLQKAQALLTLITHSRLYQLQNV